jgi:NDP-sugar pyrophosphorylase family protein
MSFPVIILAGGLGTRLGEITKTIPKALVEINGEPFLAHQLRLLRAKGIDRVVMCISHLGELIRDYAGDGSQFGLHIDYSFDGPVLLGTAGAIRKAFPLIDERFFVLYGDSYLPCDFDSIANAFMESGKLGMMTVFRNNGKWDASNVEFAHGKILAYDKKIRTPQMQFIDYGLGVFQKQAFAELPDNAPADLAELYQQLLKRGELSAREVQERFYEIGSVVGLRELSLYLKWQTEISL